MARKIKSQETNLQPGDIGGRGRHPNDPTGEIYGDQHWPLPQPHEKEKGNDMTKEKVVLYVLIDVTSLAQTKILTVAPLKEIECLGKIEQATGKQVIAPPLEGRGFSKMDAEQLQYLFWNTTQAPPPEDYAELVKQMLEVAEKCPVNDTPLLSLEKEVKRLYPDEGKKTSEAKQPGTVSKQPGTPSERPKGTSTTGRVWELGDGVLNGYLPTSEVEWKDVRGKLMAACEAEGINKATAATQYSKWKGSKLTTVAA